MGAEPLASAGLAPIRAQLIDYVPGSSYLASAPPGPQLDREAAYYGIDVIVVPLRQPIFFKLPEFCNSESWPPVYLDERSAVFVRRRPETEELIRRLHINCDDVKLPAATSDQGAQPPGWRRQPF